MPNYQGKWSITEHYQSISKNKWEAIAPGPPKNVTATGLDTTALVYFDAPDFLGKPATITGYKVNVVELGTSFTGSSSPIQATGLSIGSTYTFTVQASNPHDFGPESDPSSPLTAEPYPTGQTVYDEPGTYSWVAPTDVTIVSAVAIGGGGGGSFVGGGGGGLGWKNNITVTPGNSYTVVVGGQGANGYYNSVTGGDGGNSYFIDTSTVAGFGGSGGLVTTSPITASPGGGFVGDGGGNGGIGHAWTAGSYAANGGAGAGGYSGDGGNGYPYSSGTGSGSLGSGGSGAGGDGSPGAGTGGGGGVNLYGEGASGNTKSKAGSGGQDGYLDVNTRSDPGGYGGFFGGGGGGSDNEGPTAGKGGKGGVRIMWGGLYSFPNNADRSLVFYGTQNVVINNYINIYDGSDSTYAYPRDALPSTIGQQQTNATWDFGTDSSRFVTFKINGIRHETRLEISSDNTNWTPFATHYQPSTGGSTDVTPFLEDTYSGTFRYIRWVSEMKEGGYNAPERTKVFYLTVEDQQVYETPGTYTFVVPESLINIDVQVVAGGGGGRAGDSAGNHGEAGSAGSAVFNSYTVNATDSGDKFTKGESITVVVGAGGAGGQGDGTSGANGAISTFKSMTTIAGIGGDQSAGFASGPSNAPDGPASIYPNSVGGSGGLGNGLPDGYNMANLSFSSGTDQFDSQGPSGLEQDVLIRDNGTDLFILDYYGTIWHYSLATSFDINSTATLVRSLDVKGATGTGVSASATDFRGFTISPDGTQVVVRCDDPSITLKQFSLATPWDISSAKTIVGSYTGLGSISGVSDSRGVRFANNGNIVTLGGNNVRVSFGISSLSTPFDISSMSTPTVYDLTNDFGYTLRTNYWVWGSFYSNDGKKLITSSTYGYENVVLDLATAYDPSSYTAMSTLNSGSDMASLSFTSDGTKAVSVHNFGTVNDIVLYTTAAPQGSGNEPTYDGGAGTLGAGGGGGGGGYNTYGYGGAGGDGAVRIKWPLK